MFQNKIKSKELLIIKMNHINLNNFIEIIVYFFCPCFLGKQ